jgi:hypothetical protein
MDVSESHQSEELAGTQGSISTAQAFKKALIQFAQKVVVLERGPLSLVSTTEERLDRKVAAPV